MRDNQIGTLTSLYPTSSRPRAGQARAGYVSVHVWPGTCVLIHVVWERRAWVGKQDKIIFYMKARPSLLCKADITRTDESTRWLQLKWDKVRYDEMMWDKMRWGEFFCILGQTYVKCPLLAVPSEGCAIEQRPPTKVSLSDYWRVDFCQKANSHGYLSILRHLMIFGPKVD